MIKRSLQIVSFLFAAFFFASIKSDEVCPGDYPTHDIITVNGVSSSFTQTGCVKSFEVDITSSDLNKYLMFEIEFTSTSIDPLWMPFLLGYEMPSSLPTGQTATTARTSLLLNSGTLTVPSLTSSDSNGFLNRKSYHYIIMGPEKLNAAKTFVFSMFKTYSDSTQQYTDNFVYQVTASLSISYPCPQACSGPSQGTCDTQNKKCDCLSPYFDEDCSVLANPLKLSELSSQSIGSYSWGYFFFNIGSFDNDLKITLQKQAGDMQYSFLINEPGDYTIPNSAQSIGKYELSASQLEGYLLIQEDDISTRKNDIILIGVYNDNSASATAQVTLESYDDASLIRTVSVYLMIGLSVALLIVWLGISDKHHTQMESLIRAYQAEREEEKTLTKKDINKYFPKEKFSALKTSFCQTMCSVCLEDFEAETVCRQLYCEHIYHANCIEAWLAQHYNCPNCKKDITKVAIEEHLKEKANKEEKSMLMQDNKAAEKRGELGSPNQSVADSNTAGQRAHSRKVREEEETKENNDYAFGHAEHHVNRPKPRNLTTTTAVNIESNIRESNLQLAAIHEEGKHRNLSRVDKDFSSNPGEASRTELHSRNQNLRRPKRPGQPGTGTSVQQNPEAGVDALRLDL